MAVTQNIGQEININPIDLQDSRAVGVIFPFNGSLSRLRIAPNLLGTFLKPL